MTQNKSSYTTGESDRTTEPNHRQWLPGVRHSKSLSSKAFFFVLIAVAFTALFLFIDEGFWSKVGSVLSSAFFGLMLNHWWSEFLRGDAERREAIELDDRVEEEIQRISEHWRQAIHALKALINENPHPEFVRASGYFIGQQMNMASGRIERAALRMDKLGFSSSVFLAEKEEQLTKVKNNAFKVVMSMPKDTNIELLLELFADVEQNKENEVTSSNTQQKVGREHETVDGGPP